MNSGLYQPIKFSFSKYVCLFISVFPHLLVKHPSEKFEYYSATLNRTVRLNVWMLLNLSFLEFYRPFIQKADNF